jgi:hypothetical protein
VLPQFINNFVYLFDFKWFNSQKSKGKNVYLVPVQFYTCQNYSLAQDLSIMEICEEKPLNINR